MAGRGGLDRVLDDLTRRVEVLRHVVVLSYDGLVTAHSEGIGTPEAERLAAVASGLHSLARGAGEHVGAGGVRQTMIQFEEGLLVVTTAGDGGALAVLADGDADAEPLADAMALLVNRVGERLGTTARPER